MNSKGSNVEECELCGQTRFLTRHHLIPRKLHGRKKTRKRFSRTELQACVMICRICHDGIHNLYDEKTLAEKFFPIESLQQDRSISRHVAWPARHKLGT